MSANYSLLCYTREATGREEANNEDYRFTACIWRYVPAMTPSGSR